ncbi:MAG: hypothetical protein AB7H97_17535, partial [Pseudobdellovibrionaceae bacterium]
MNRTLKFIIWGAILSMTLGFRVFPGTWQISKNDPTIWIKLCDDNNSLTIDENDLEDGDPLAGVTNLTFDQVIQSVIDDYNDVPTSYLRLALYPSDPTNPGAPIDGDSTFTTQKAANR